MATYSDRLSQQYHDSPPDDEGFGKFGIWYEEIDPITAAYLRDVTINSVEDEMAFYAYFSQTPSRGFLCAIVNGVMIQPFTEELEESVEEILNRSPDQEFRDAQKYFQFHGLSQDILFKFLQPRIDAWKILHPEDTDSYTCVYDPAQPRVYYDLGWIPDYDGVLVDIQGNEVNSCRLRAGANAEAAMDYRPVSPVYRPGEYQPEVPQVTESSRQAVEILEELNFLHPVNDLRSGVSEFVQEVQLDLNFQKLQAGYAIDTDAYNYVALSMKPTFKFHTRLPQSSLEYYVFGSLLMAKEHLDEQVPEKISEVYPEIAGLTMERGLAHVHSRARKYMAHHAKKRRALTSGAKRRAVVFESGGVVFDPGEEGPSGERAEGDRGKTPQ